MKASLKNIRRAAALVLLTACSLLLLGGCADADASENDVQDTASETSGDASVSADTAETDAAETDAADADTLSEDAQDVDASFSKYDAVAIALEDAGVSIDEVTRLDSGKDSGADYAYYEIEFYTASMNYYYEIDADTAEIVSLTDRSIEGSTEAQTGLIALDEAKQTALSDAGCDAADAAFAKLCLQEEDDGVYVYEIEFEAGSIEYEYEIDAQDGEIISRD